MQILKTHYHPDIKNLENKTVFTRLATRSIAMKGDDILLLYTERYEDYSLPGGGLDEGESKTEGMVRELTEETGAKDIKNIKPFGAYEEYRPWYKPDFDIQHMISYCYTCDIDRELGASNLEAYEIKNGMKAKWINIHKAIKHNEKIIATSEKKGMSIERETFLLKLIAKSSEEENAPKKQPNNPLHGVKLAAILEFLVKEYGWEKLAMKININCFKKDPSIKSSLKFLRKTPWARDKVEELYIHSIHS